MHTKCIVPSLLHDVRKSTMFGGDLVIKVPTTYQLSYLIWFVWLEDSIYYGWSNLLKIQSIVGPLSSTRVEDLGAFSSTSYWILKSQTSFWILSLKARGLIIFTRFAFSKFLMQYNCLPSSQMRFSVDWWKVWENCWKCYKIFLQKSNCLKLLVCFKWKKETCETKKKKRIKKKISKKNKK